MDNNLMAKNMARIHLSIQQSSNFCYLFYGHPKQRIITPILSEEKFVPAAAWRMYQLGLDIDTRCIQVIYSLPEHTKLLVCINVG